MHRHTLNLVMAGLIAVGPMGLFVSKASAADTSNTERDRVAAEITEKLNKVAKMLTDGTSPEAILRFVTTTDYISDSPGAKVPTSGKALIPAQAEEMKAIKAPCSVYIEDPDKYGPLETSGTLAAAFVTVRCASAKPGAPDFSTRSLFVWRRTPDGWKISREMEVEGN
jgi:hypothetical protein